MWTVITQSLVILGVLAGVVLAKIISDETQWYQNYFLAAASSGFLITAVLISPWYYGVILSALAILALAYKKYWALGIVAGLLASISSLLGLQVLTAALVFVGGYAVHYKQEKQLGWFVLMPIVIILLSFL